MKINYLKIKNFRLIEDFESILMSNQIIIIGPNGSGKTTMIEAIHFCCFLTSFRTNKKSELLTFDKEVGSINIKYKNNNSNNMDIFFSKDQVNIVKNKIKETRRLDVIGDIKTLLLSPSFDEYVSGSPKIRRKYLDMYISQYDKGYALLITKYNKLAQQRSSVLKNDKVDMVLLEIMTKQYDEIIEKLRIKRKDFLEIIKKNSKSIVSILSSNDDIIDFRYVESSKSTIDKEVLYKKSLYGLQFDDFEIYLNNVVAKKFASQGQKRTISIALILSQLEIIKEVTGEYPIVMIDDVHIELDAKRQSLLFQILDKNIQTFFVSTDIFSIPNEIKKKAQIFSVESGKIIEKK